MKHPKRPVTQTLLVVISLLLGACGRSPTAATGANDGSVTDGWVSLGDGHIAPERPGRDIYIPPPRDGSPTDGWVPPFDSWPPPTDGPCSATCVQKCQLLKTCNMLPGDVGQCASQQCPTWPSFMDSCLGYLVCNPPPGPICPLAQQCAISPTQKPDLTITGFKAAVQGGTVTYGITTCNTGLGASGPFIVDLYWNRSTPPTINQHGNQYASIGGLAAGGCTTTTLTRSNTPTGGYVSWAQVDADNKVAETSEINNVAGPLKVTVTTTPPPVGPDLTIKSLVTTIYGSSSTIVRYQMEICNIGAVASGSTQVHVYYNRATAPTQLLPGDKYTTVPGLQPAACTTRNIYRYGTPQGTFNSWAQVDPYNQIAESNETNNVIGPVIVTVGTSVGADLTIKTFDHTIYGSSGSTVRYRMQVCNVGTGSSGTTEVHVYFNRTTAPVAGLPGDQTTTVPTLQAGACSYRYIYRQGTPQGTFTSWAQVDPYNQVKETVETNNIAGPKSVVVGVTPLPPPPPPPGVCPDLCSYVINTCQFLTPSQYNMCIGACNNLTLTQITCAQTAKTQGQCNQLLLCMF